MSAVECQFLSERKYSLNKSRISCRFQQNGNCLLGVLVQHAYRIEPSSNSIRRDQIRSGGSGRYRHWLQLKVRFVFSATGLV
ncbi:hypothetical protein DTO166G5_5312 [Paecilomyces variotii]|nr:hypothetical protein DTO169C6_911 [Paecilomyces variotii]KAJ9231475.1 hypothetical protein DTO169E5_7941 [Paecilomyces variotii]KAJ9234251.1 hypothetical protein DTO166G5_5312 [Paecilomyces variotii]KAJ9252653.1 hypothetical protein DTO207G8_4715 [Paecilomyces variotii]KAJ9362609.1 hypothetical protein DTO027B9_286 [Paecilomyces variotii]